MTHKIIYLHGFASSPKSSKAQEFARRFAKSGQKIEIPDLAEGAFEQLTITGQLEVVKRLANGKPVGLIGSSLGGYLAALYASRHPEVEWLVLMAPAFDFARRWTDQLGQTTMEEWSRTGSLSLYHYGAAREEPLGFQFIQDAKRYEPFPSVAQPALVLQGLNDDVVPHELSAEFARRNPNVRLELLESDHQLGDVVDQLWQLTTGFIPSDAK